MKYIKFSWVLIIFSLLSSSEVLAQKNVIKLTLTDIFITKLSGSYEYAFNEKMSLNLNVGWLPSRDIFFADILIDEDETDFDGDIDLGGISVAPELRFYLAGDAPEGFFLGPYLVYSSYGLSTTYNYENSNTGTNLDAEATGFIDSFGGGGVLGYQWITDSGLALDLFFGLGVTNSRLGISVEDERLLEGDLAEIAEEIEEALDIPFFDFDTSISDAQVQVKAPGVPVPNIRLGFALGYSF